MRNSPCTDMFDDNFHFRIIGETPILLLEAKMGRMKVYNEGRRMLCIFFQDVLRCFH